MCRQAAYIGPATSVGAFVLDPPHGLLKQSYLAKELLSGVVNADGFGVAWWVPELDGEPALYRSIMPVWSDASFASVARRVASPCIVANLRNATEPGTTAVANVHPFQDGRSVFTHNGFLEGFRKRWMRRLRGRLSDEQYARIEGVTDSETIFRLLRTRMEAGRSMLDSLDVLWELASEAQELGLEAQLNVLAADGERLYATRLSAQGPSNSLYVAHEAAAWPGATVVASEPFDHDAAWREVPDGSVVACLPGQAPTIDKRP